MVPLATVAGTPRKIMRGNVMAEPLLASVLMNPESSPAAMITATSTSGLMERSWGQGLRTRRGG